MSRGRRWRRKPGEYPYEIRINTDSGLWALRVFDGHGTGGGGRREGYEDKLDPKQTKQGC